MAPASLDRTRRAATEAAAPAAAAAAVPATTTITTTPTPTPTPTDAYTGLGSSPSGTTSQTPSPSAFNASTTALLVVVVLCAAAAVMSAALFYLFDRKKHAQFREACRRDPYLTRKEFARRRKLSALERLEEEEMQRSIMIRKSLASREPSRQNSYEDFDLARLQQQQHRFPHEYHHGARSVSVYMPRMRSASELSSSSSSASSARHHYADPHPGVEVDTQLTPHSRSPSPSPVRRPLVRVSTVVPPPAVSEMKEISSPRLSKPSDVPVHLS